MGLEMSIYEEVLRRCFVDEGSMSADLLNDLLDRCDGVEDFIGDVVREFEDRIKSESKLRKKESGD